MFAARTHNENAVYNQQTAAAAKPLNAGVKGLAPKTPGNAKTPFKGNDENAAFGAGKTGGKGKGESLFELKGGKAERSAFITPAGTLTIRNHKFPCSRSTGPRTRAPLGAKTTNARALAQPPPQELLSAKPSSPRLRRAKIKIHEAPAVEDAAHPEEREIEYMPPRGVPLPDYPDDWPHDRAYPQLEGPNLTRGWAAEFFPPPSHYADDDDNDGLGDFNAKLKKVEEREARAKKIAAAAKAKQITKKDVPVVVSGGSGGGMRAPSTLKSRDAASALSSTNVPRFAAPTLAARARHDPAKKVVLAGAGNTRHTAAKVASNNTLGYSKGRAVSATARNPLANVHAPLKAGEAVPAKMPFTLEDLLGLGELELGEGDEKLGEDGGMGALGLGDLVEEDEEAPLFQLDAVEL